MRFPGRLFCAILWLAGTLSYSFGQAPAPHRTPAHAAAKRLASLSGQVTDQVGKPIAGAEVKLSGSGQNQSVNSDAQGNYAIKGLPSGTYDLSVTANGFKKFEATGITLNPGESLPVDATMDPIPGAAPAAAPVQAATPEPGQQQQPAAPEQNPGFSPLAPVTQANMPTLAGAAAVSGSVSDKTGAVIAGATVTATSSTGYTQTANTNERGEYLLKNLPPGTYDVSISALGFKEYDSKGVALASGGSLSVNANLEPAGAATEVNVEGQKVAEVETETAQVSGTITQKEVVKIGLNGRNFTQLIALTPGVSNQTGQDEAKVGVSGSVKYSVNGGRVEYNNFDVDGSDVLNAGLNGAESTLVVYPSLDAIGEVKVLTSNYGAMYGRSASGTVLVTTKSGTPQFHGNLYEFLRNENMNARNYFDQTRHAPLYRRNDFGGTIGGPLFIPNVFNTKKDKTFFFFSEEFRIEKSPTDFNQGVPTLAERNGDFSDVCPAAGPGVQVDYLRTNFPDCPAGALGAGAGVFRTFPGNKLPIDPNAQILLNTGVIPLPNSFIGCNSSLAGANDPQTGLALMPCYTASVSLPTYWREELFRIDQNLGAKVRASFRYIHDSWDTTVATPQWGFIQNSFPTIQNRLSGPGTSLVARLTTTVSPSLLNEFVFSYVNSSIKLRNLAAEGGNFVRPPGLTTGSLFDNGFGGKMPGLVVSGTNAEYGGVGFAADPAYMPWEHSNPTYSLEDSVSKVIGKHTLQMGVAVLNSRRSETNGAIGAATGDLQGFFTFSNQNSRYTTGNAFADVLRNLNGNNSIKSFTQDSAQLKYYNDYWIAEPYVQDDWRMSRRLTLNLGIRFSIFGNFHEKNLNAWNWVDSSFDRQLASTVKIDPFFGYLTDLSGNPIPFDFRNPPAVLSNGLVRCGTNGVPDSCQSSKLFNPAPRIGFAWDPKGDGKTSIRAGYGVFFEHGTAKEANTGSLEGSAPNVLTMTSPNVVQYTCLQGGICPTPAAYPLDVTSIQTNTMWPYVQQWSLSVQRELPKDMVATVAYVGSKGTHLTAELQVNQLHAVKPESSTGIFLNGNPFDTHQPVTSSICNTFNFDSHNSFLVTGDQQTNAAVVTPDEPAWKNLSAACFGVSSAIPDPNTLRTFAPGFGRVLSLQNVADSHYNALQATLRRSRGPLTLGVSYTYSHSIDDSSDRSDSTFVDSFNLASNRASSNYDQRHLLTINYVYDFPKLSTVFRNLSGEDPPAKQDDQPQSTPPPQSESRLLHLLVDNWQLSGITTFQSGTPFSVINGGSNAGISVLDNAGVANGAGAGSFPDVIGDAKASPAQSGHPSQSIGPTLLNPAAFAAPRGLTFGNAGRNYLNNPNRLNFDVALLKIFKVKESASFELRAEAFNVFNHTQFRIYNPNLGNQAQNTISCYGGPDNSAAGGLTRNPDGTTSFVDCLTGSSFLHPVDAHRARTLQLGVKFSF